MPLCVQQVTTIYVDKDIVVVDKPSGLLSVPGKNPLNKDCLITRVQQQYADAQIVHRLDMDTSGVMVLARGKANLSALSRQFQERQIQKHYLAPSKMSSNVWLENVAMVLPSEKLRLSKCPLHRMSSSILPKLRSYLHKDYQQT